MKKVLVTAISVVFFPLFPEVSMRWLIRLLVSFLFALATLTGCSPPPPKQDSVFQRTETEAVLLVGVDISGSFFHKVFGPDAKVFNILGISLERFMQAHPGAEARIVIFQIGADVKELPPLLFDGTVHDFRRECGSPDAFKQFVLSHASTAGSRIFASMADAFNYLVNMYPGKERLVSLVFTDGEDNVKTAESARMLELALQQYGRRGGALGIYGLTQGIYMNEMIRMVKMSGIKNPMLAHDFNRTPPLPDWD